MKFISIVPFLPQQKPQYFPSVSPETPFVNHNNRPSLNLCLPGENQFLSLAVECSPFLVIETYATFRFYIVSQSSNMILSKKVGEYIVLDLFDVEKIVYKDTKITITDPARTFIECLDRLDLSGGWEECLKSLANLKGINILDLKDVLSIYDNKTLELKTGYVLELLSRSSPFYEHIKPADLQVFKPSDTWIPVYLDRDVPSKFIKKWGLYIPEGTDDLLRGI